VEKRNNGGLSVSRLLVDKTVECSHPWYVWMDTRTFIWNFLFLRGVWTQITASI